MLKAEGGMWMHIKEAARQTEMSVRAIKHYEEKGLLQPEKDESGYRVFREQDLERLRQISVYRKLGMEIAVIREVLNDPKKERAALERLYEQKQSERTLCEQQLCAIRDLLAQAGDTAVKEALKADAQRYERIRTQVQQNTARSKRFSFSFHLKRRVNRELKRCGYYDVFLPAMERLSPSYRQYRRSLLALEEQICTELGISSSVEGRMGMRSCDEQRMR